MGIHLREDLNAGSEALETHRLVVLSAPGGYGKTTLARAWCELSEVRGRPFAWISVRRLHADPALFAEDLLGEVRAALPDRAADGFGEEVLRAAHQGVDPESLARLLARALDRLEQPLILCLDGFEHLDGESRTAHMIDSVLRVESAPVHWLITTRGSLPRAAAGRIATSEAKEIGAAELSLRSDQIQSILQEEGVSLSQLELTRLLARTQGWAIGVRFAARALAGLRPADRAQAIGDLVRQRDLFRYVTSELMADVSPEVVTLLETASVVGWVPSDLLCAASGLERPWEAHERALDSGLLHHRGGRVGVHDLLADWIRMRGEGESTPGVQRDRAIAIGARLEERGHLVSALEISLAYDDARSIARLLRRHGHDWVNRGHYALVEDALGRLPEREIEADPALRAVAGVLAGGRHPAEAIEHLAAAVAGYREAGDRAAQFAVLNEMAILAANTNRVAEVRRRASGALRIRDLVLEPRLRGMLLQFAANGSFVRGRFVRALQLLDLADRFDHQVRERAGIGLLRAVIRFHRGEWDEVVQEVDARCADPEQRLHGPGYHAMQVWRAAVDALRGGSVEACREALEDAERMFRAAGHTLNLIYVDIVRGWVAARVSDGERAEPAIERAIETARSIRLHEIEAGAWGQLARARQRAGRPEAAREAAEHALEMLADDKAWSSPSPRAVFWTPAIATAALVLAELGDAERAQRALLVKRRGLEHGELAPGRHTVAVVAARIAHLLGDSKTVRSELELAASVRRAHPAMERAPEEDSALREWADHRAASDPPRETRSKRGEPKSKPGGAGTLASGLQIATFGGLELRLDGRILTPRDWHGQQTRRLFARLLAAEGRPVTREQLAADLWPEASARSAGGRLRVALSRLRSAIEPKRNGRATARHVQVEREHVRLSSRALADWDVTRWRRALETLGDASRDADAARARASLDVLEATRRGPFLPELYDEWTLEQRRQLEERWIATTRSLAALWLQRGEPRIAAELAEGLTATHRGEEEGWRLLAEARLAQGDRSGALRAIEAARQALDSELGLPLGEALTTLARRLRTGDGAGAAAPVPSRRR